MASPLNINYTAPEQLPLKMSKKELEELQKLQYGHAPVDIATFNANYRTENRYKKKVGGKWVWHDRKTGKPWDDKEVLKAFNIDKYSTATPNKDLKFLKSKQLLINKTNIEKPGMQGGVGYNIRRAFSAPTEDPNVKVFDLEQAEKRKLLANSMLKSQAESSYATPTQNAYLGNLEGWDGKLGHNLQGLKINFDYEPSKDGINPYEDISALEGLDVGQTTENVSTDVKDPNKVIEGSEQIKGTNNVPVEPDVKETNKEKIQISDDSTNFIPTVMDIENDARTFGESEKGMQRKLKMMIDKQKAEALKRAQEAIKNAAKVAT
tara:strand:- start:617 stop:1579 length:963 start_codon:yes stop_codon:yes gene_type:complete